MTKCNKDIISVGFFLDRQENGLFKFISLIVVYHCLEKDKFRGENWNSRIKENSISYIVFM